MISELLNILFYLMALIHIMVLVISIYNFFTAPRVNKIKSNEAKHIPVSILIPARNEERNIKNCLDSIYNNSYKNFEVIALDDNSTDSTLRILKEYKSSKKSLNIIEGKPLPSNWLGKNWACHQLAQQSSNDIILFLDADVTLDSSALEFAVAKYLNADVDLLSVFPSQKIRSFGEWLVVPLMEWLLYSFLPLKKIYTSKNKLFSAANGQFLIMNKESYLKFGGHEKIKNKIVEDMQFVRGFKEMNFKTITLAGNNFVHCRMYDGFNDAVGGYSKNFFPGFKLNMIAFLIFIFALFAIFFIPIVLSFIDYKFFVIAALIFIERIFTSAIAKQNLSINLILFFPQMIVLFYAGLKSLIDNKLKKVVWKNRIVN